MSVRSPQVRRRVREWALDRCVYCHAPESLSWSPHEVDHIVPANKGGTNDDENLCLGCRDCNLYKSDHIVATDPLTGESASLFHPRLQDWNTHFRWSVQGNKIEGSSPTGRATIHLLRMNEVAKVKLRELWVKWGEFPPPTDARAQTTDNVQP